MTIAETTALALLRSGRSFDEAATAAHLPIAAVMRLWLERGHKGSSL